MNEMNQSVERLDGILKGRYYLSATDEPIRIVGVVTAESDREYLIATAMKPGIAFDVIDVTDVTFFASEEECLAALAAEESAEAA